MTCCSSVGDTVYLTSYSVGHIIRTSPWGSRLACDLALPFVSHTCVDVVVLRLLHWELMAWAVDPAVDATIVILPSMTLSFAHSLQHMSHHVWSPRVRREETRWHDTNPLECWPTSSVGRNMPWHLCTILQGPGNKWSRKSGGTGRGEERSEVFPVWCDILVHSSGHRDFRCNRPKIKGFLEGAGETSQVGKWRTQSDQLPTPTTLSGCAAVGMLQ